MFGCLCSKSQMVPMYNALACCASVSLALCSEGSQEGSKLTRMNRCLAASAQSLKQFKYHAKRHMSVRFFGAVLKIFLRMLKTWKKCSHVWPFLPKNPKTSVPHICLSVSVALYSKYSHTCSKRTSKD